MQGLVQAMQTQAHTQAALQAQLEAQEPADVWWSSLLLTRFEDGAVEVGWDEFALSVACRQEGEMEQYLEEKKASQKRPAAPFQRQERKKAAFQSPQHPVASGSGQLASTSVDVDCESTAISMDAYSESTTRDVDVNIPDQLRFQIQNHLRKHSLLF
ncbi:hypothetical protein Taro_004098 [Colocasia esculenta]|uniref:Uncharacterized protein n=1 Tax=Colocasia esculenta TaxID=4460 RepID=A0A843TNK1_COLES|nr:hypothetical protein [Colocasia esculenta]